MAVSEATGKIPVGISSCLLGEEVRYNGGHKHQRYCTEVLSEYFDFQSFCPEVAIGMGIPREPIRLVGGLASPRAVGTKTAEVDVTDQLLDYAESMAGLASACSGFIWMKDSPSCGLFSTKVYQKDGAPPAKRAGLVAAVVRERLPLLPMEEGGRLNDSVLRENFITRVLIYHQWKQMLRSPLSPSALVDFHSRHKYLVMSYGQALYKTLGRMVARAGSAPIDDLGRVYIESFMKGTEAAPTRAGHVNVLFHLLGYLKEVVPGGIRQDLVQAIEEYRTELVPLAVPMKMMSHYIDNYASSYVKQQSYLSPHPFELGLRNTL